ncbi:MFS general substrate transporter [Cristinia sonorae]|uniref:MFS general substrate transporter n=1 Tax=Cristinia sonorae TaxID=1940300 RepID=A0A8K0ULY0_9AGAR|nr:MFS general substrate transporter [Cristinia sonorae]
MTVTTHDEETPLLPEQQKKKKMTPLPWGQFTILLILQLAEPFTSQVINPFAPQLIRDVGITHGDETKVGYYVGLMQSIFFATQALTVLHWSRLSDHLGRKPIIMTGLFGLSLSMYSFGLSKTYWGAVVSRSLNGALNGNIGVLKSMVAEITDSTNLAYAYAYLPISWSTGQAIGPAVGGYFSRPADQFPDIFGNNTFLKEHPYFLACAIPATFSAIAWFVTLIFLEETVTSPMSIRRFLSMRTGKANLTLQNVSGQDNRVGPAGNSEEVDKTSPARTKPLPLKEILSGKVIIAALNYASLSLTDIAVRSVQPVFYSTPIELGGLNLPPYKIGRILSIYGVMNGLIQIFVFAGVHNRYGTRRVYIWSIASALPVVAMYPVINLFAKTEGDHSIYLWIAVGIQLVLSILINFAYGCIFIFITAASPNKASLGTVNGFCQVGVSIMRTIGPALANSLFSLSIDEKHHYLGGNLVYAALATLVCLSLVCADYLPKPSIDDD